MITADKNKLRQIVSNHLYKKSSNKKFIGTIYSDLDSINAVLSYFKEIYQDKVDSIAALDGSGYILGSMLARELNVAFVPVAKEREYNEFDDEYYRSSYINHRDEACSVVIRKDCLAPNCRVLIVDNWIESGATVQAILSMLEDAEVNVVGIAAFGIDKNPRTESLKNEINITAIIEE
jgi:adenine phosphoribosyltransferase